MDHGSIVKAAWLLTFELPWGFRQKKGYQVATFDMEHHDSMDFLKPSGFLLPGLFHTMALSHHIPEVN